ncbi:hypothetical protein HYH05_17245 [Escherichia coli]|uniref:hypothetical protein n=1 Tax=Escherichia coli TaxID=562 RepID=UPI0015C5C020|nr:hypothetical protein [Escherichia coli]QLG67481.1 hypothetical protein HYH05_17245 [Escherichia coli]
MAENIIDKARYGSPELKVSTPNNIVDSVAIIIATFLLEVKVTTKNINDINKKKKICKYLLIYVLYEEL